MTDHAADSTHRIVVGVDGSPGSKKALTWAMNQAQLTGASIEAITTWQDPAQYGTAYGWTAAAFESETFATTMVKDLDDGSKAVGLCNAGEFATEITAEWPKLGL